MHKTAASTLYTGARFTDFEPAQMFDEQARIVAFLRQPMLHSGRSCVHVETPHIHLICSARTIFTLPRPLYPGGAAKHDCLTTEQRWAWCERVWQAELGQPANGDLRPLPVVRRGSLLHLGGPGMVEDWVLVRRLSTTPELVRAAYTRLPRMKGALKRAPLRPSPRLQAPSWHGVRTDAHDHSPSP